MRMMESGCPSDRRTLQFYTNAELEMNYPHNVFFKDIENVERRIVVSKQRIIKAM